MSNKANKVKGAMLALALLVSPAAAMELQCGSEELFEKLEATYPVIGHGVVSSGLIELRVAADGKFVVILRPSKERTQICLIVEGDGWDVLRAPPTGKEKGS